MKWDLDGIEMESRWKRYWDNGDGSTVKLCSNIFERDQSIQSAIAKICHSQYIELKRKYRLYSLE